MKTRKWLSLLLACMLMLGSLGLTALADEDGGNGEEVTATVKASLTPGLEMLTIEGTTKGLPKEAVLRVKILNTDLAFDVEVIEAAFKADYALAVGLYEGYSISYKGTVLLKKANQFEILPLALENGDPNAVDPNAVDPNAVDPNAVDPNAIDPNAVDPNAGDLKTVDPNAVDPNAVDPNAVDPDAVDPDAVDPNAVDPNAVDPNAVDPNAVDLNAVDPNAVDPNAVDPNAVDPNAVDPNAVDPNAVDPNAVDPTARSLTVIDMTAVVDKRSIVVSGIAGVSEGVKVSIVPNAQAEITTATDAAGAFTATFVDLPPEKYTVTVAYTDGLGTPVSADATVYPGMALDYIVNDSALVSGITDPYLRVTVQTWRDTHWEAITVLSNFRGAFFAAFDKPQKAGEIVTVIVAFGTNQLERNDYTVLKPKDVPSYTYILREGSRGAKVLALQDRLIALGYTATATGNYDIETVRAVYAFQRVNNLEMDGIAGPATLNTLYSVTAREMTANPVGSAGVLAYGDDSWEVREMQSRLRKLNYYFAKVDGKFRQATWDAVYAFEKRNKLPSDGIADVAMQTLLFSGAAKAAPKPQPTATPTPSPTPTAAPLSTPMPPVPMSAPDEMLHLRKETLIGTLRLDTVDNYIPADTTMPGLILSATLTDVQGKPIACRVRWQSAQGSFLAWDVLGGALANVGNPCINDGGLVYWTADPAELTLNARSELVDKQGNVVDPLTAWRIKIEILHPQNDEQIWTEAELQLVLQEDGWVLMSSVLQDLGWTLDMDVAG